MTPSLLSRRRPEQSRDTARELRIAGLTAGYGGSPAIEDLYLHVAPGEAVAMLGPNGAGKTTLLRTISALVKPASGSITFADAELVGARPDRVVAEGIAHVPQGRQIFVEQTVLDNLLLGAYLRRDRAAIQDDLDYVLRVFPVLGDKLRKPAGDLSGGQQQALAVGRALMSRASLLLLDEPSLGLGPRVSDTLSEVLETVRTERRVAFLLVEQDAPFALELCERAYVLRRGKIVMDRPANELLDDREIVYAYLGGGADVPPPGDDEDASARS